VRAPAAALGAIVAALIVSGCSGATTTPFARAARDGSGTFSAAATALTDLHSGRLTREYAAATLGVLGSQVEQLPDELRGADGAPAPDAASRAANEAERALTAFSRPCLDNGCEWRAQAELLKAAARSLAELAAPAGS
jgi:hypothetical protein